MGIRAVGIHVMMEAGTLPTHIARPCNIISVESSRAYEQCSLPCLQPSGPSIVQHSGRRA